ncbi:MAG: hemolysin family protein [Arcanobacterium sp.]|nr:hemolysin family protein [Arcanobacterium sp.]MDY5589381.1 hemolysin family protein [Arcanobacterium sp.]
MQSFSPIPMIVIAVLCALAVAYWGVVRGALNRMTLSDASEAASKRLGGVNLVSIVEHRQAALIAVNIVQLLHGMVAAVAVTLAIGTVVHHPWLLALSAASVACALILLVAFTIPARIGYAYPVNVLASCSHVLWAATRIMAHVDQRREPDTAEEREERQEDQLAVMVERVSESDAVQDDERELLHSVFELDTTYVREVMVPRPDMISISAEASLDKALSLFSRSGYSRVPVIGESIDDLLGVLYLKDVIRRVHHHNDAAGVTAANVMREALFVPETKLVDDMLHEMQRTAVHIAIVIDEYGGVAGLVTIEDLLEELVGEMVDEHDRGEPQVDDLGDGRYRVPARMPIDELGALYGLEIDDDDVDSVGGLLAKAIGRVPIIGAQGSAYGIHMEAERFEGRRKRLSTVIVERDPHSDAEGSEGEQHE